MDLKIDWKQAQAIYWDNDHVVISMPHNTVIHAPITWEEACDEWRMAKK